MNKLQIGFSKNIDECLDELRTLRDRTDTGLLYINDEVPDLPQASRFDVGSSNLNPLADIDYKHARHLAEVLYSAYPQGENTLTVRNGRRQLLKAFLKYNRFDKLEGTEEVEWSAPIEWPKCNVSLALSSRLEGAWPAKRLPSA